MSKADAQRAMREAKYARLRASGPTRREAAANAGTPAVPPAPKPAAKKPAARVAEVEEPVLAATPQGALCGHKSINGRACTRPAGHAEKNHRYG